MQRRYQNYHSAEEEEFLKSPDFVKTALFFHNPYPRSFNGNSWDAKHLTSFLRKSNYSNWKGESANISRLSNPSHQRSYSSTQGDHFFKTTKDNRNVSKIGCTPLFPLVSNAPISASKDITLSSFFQSSELPKERERIVSGRSVKLRCNPEDQFKFEGNALKFIETDPVTCQHQPKPFESVNGFQKERMARLIISRHPHGMTGIDHPENPDSAYYNPYEEKIRVRQEPNAHQSFLLSREWKQKKRSRPPVDEWKHRKTTTIRTFRNQNTHGYNILTNRKDQ